MDSAMRSSTAIFFLKLNLSKIETEAALPFFVLFYFGCVSFTALDHRPSGWRSFSVPFIFQCRSCSCWWGEVCGLCDHPNFSGHMARSSVDIWQAMRSGCE